VLNIGPLPGSPLFTSLDSVIERALRDARALREGGCDGFVIENFGDRPLRAVVSKQRRSPR
jgi:predicted TIM-barrel enzyme